MEGREGKKKTLENKGGQHTPAKVGRRKNRSVTNSRPTPPRTERAVPGNVVCQGPRTCGSWGPGHSHTAQRAAREKATPFPGERGKCLPPDGRDGDSRVRCRGRCALSGLEGWGVHLKGGSVYQALLATGPWSQYLNGWDMALGCPLTSSNLQKPKTDAQASPGSPGGHGKDRTTHADRVGAVNTLSWREGGPCRLSVSVRAYKTRSGPAGNLWWSCCVICTSSHCKLLFT